MHFDWKTKDLVRFIESYQIPFGATPTDFSVSAFRGVVNGLGLVGSDKMALDLSWIWPTFRSQDLLIYLSAEETQLSGSSTSATAALLFFLVLTPGACISCCLRLCPAIATARATKPPIIATGANSPVTENLLYVCLAPSATAVAKGREAPICLPVERNWLYKPKI